MGRWFRKRPEPDPFGYGARIGEMVAFINAAAVSTVDVRDCAHPLWRAERALCSESTFDQCSSCGCIRPHDMPKDADRG